MAESGSVAGCCSLGGNQVRCASCGWAISKAVEYEEGYTVTGEAFPCGEGTTEGGRSQDWHEVIPGVMQDRVVEAEGNGMR